MTDSTRGVHPWFGLSYAAYAVQPRVMLQSMPGDWQDRFVALMEEAEAMGYSFPLKGTTYAVNLRHDETGRYIYDRDRDYRHRRAERRPDGVSTPQTRLDSR